MPDKVRSTDPNEFSKLNKSRIELFVKNFENIYTEILIEYDMNNEKIISIIKDLLEKRTDLNDLSKKIFLDYNEIRSKWKSFDEFFKEKINLHELV